MKNLTSPESGKRHTMNRMLAVAREEFSSKCLAGARIEQIARDVGVTKQLTYHYYSSKEELFAAVLDETSENITSELVTFKVEHLPPVEALRALFNHFFDQYRNDPLLTRLAQEGIRYHGGHQRPRNRFLESALALIKKTSEIIQRGIENGDFRSDVQPRLFLAAAALITSGWFTNGYSTSALVGLGTTSAEGMDTWRKYSVDLVMSSICVPQQDKDKLQQELTAHGCA